MNVFTPIVLGICAGTLLTGCAAPKESGVKLLNIRVTQYQATKGQCDSTPDIGAYGRVARKGVPTGRWFASNFLPKDTKIVIPAVSTKDVWICRDRMSDKLNNRIDLLVLTVNKDLKQNYDVVIKGQ